jgi:hypothetical protein
VRCQSLLNSRGFTVSWAWPYSPSQRSLPPYSPRLSSSSSWIGIAVGPPNYDGLQFAHPNLQSVVTKPGYNVSGGRVTRVDGIRSEQAVSLLSRPSARLGTSASRRSVRLAGRMEMGRHPGPTDPPPGRDISLVAWRRAGHGSLPRIDAAGRRVVGRHRPRRQALALEKRRRAAVCRPAKANRPQVSNPGSCSRRSPARSSRTTSSSWQGLTFAANPYPSVAIGWSNSWRGTPTSGCSGRRRSNSGRGRN